IAYKRNMGYRFGYDSTFTQFDHFLYDNGYASISLTKEICRQWEKKRPNESDMTRYQRVGLIHNYALFLARKGYETAAPEHDYKPRSTFTPYIFTQEELEKFFCACDSFGGYASAAYPALLRTIYGCGLRRSEALNIRIQDVDFDRKTIFVRTSKNGTERMLPVSDSVFHAIEGYYNLFRTDAAEDDFLFVTRFGAQICGNALHTRFQQCLERAGITYGGRGKGPRIHDLRHSFSVHTMARMAEQGIDLYCFLPVLSKYLGHKSIKATEGYVRLTAEMYPKLLDDVNKICAHIYPEVTP
ncbi:MAG: tyrosine-type recombinase/integrase, partial [Lachnospiraceae bacterium]|nr:tyrosine-type recombinase/integrase [Lachnospiraceae bacterium]